MRVAASLSSETQRMARPSFVRWVNWNSTTMTMALMTMVSRVVYSSVTPAKEMPPAVKIWLATLGLGPMAGIAWARFSSSRLMAMAVMRAVILVPFFRTGR